jgi:hypothetical protein
MRTRPIGGKLNLTAMKALGALCKADVQTAVVRQLLGPCIRSNRSSRTTKGSKTTPDLPLKHREKDLRQAD